MTSSPAAPSTGLDAVHGEFLVEAEVGCIQRARLDIHQRDRPSFREGDDRIAPVPEMIGITVMVEIASRVVTIAGLADKDIAAHPGIDRCRSPCSASRTVASRHDHPATRSTGKSNTELLTGQRVMLRGETPAQPDSATQRQNNRHSR
ncbi:MAG: hypothetical protein OXC93_14925 [Rhodospirillaceae bacterium]|nr:hypothetical protein [Rhodospirillaceae bacterium]